jgi:hypothetical protein
VSLVVSLTTSITGLHRAGADPSTHGTRRARIWEPAPLSAFYRVASDILNGAPDDLQLHCVSGARHAGPTDDLSTPTTSSGPVERMGFGSSTPPTSKAAAGASSEAFADESAQSRSLPWHRRRRSIGRR